MKSSNSVAGSDSRRAILPIGAEEWLPTPNNKAVIAMTNSSAINPDLLLSQALAGSRECFGRLLHVYRNYLKLLVMSQLEKKLQRRISASDVVQETFLEANRDFAQFRGQSSGEFCAWLRRILVNNLHRVVEQHVLGREADRPPRGVARSDCHFAGTVDRRGSMRSCPIPARRRA